MILEMKVPSPGESITEVEIADWLVQDGDYVEKDQAIAEVDSDKATLELPAEASGTITLQAEVGDAIAVGAVVCLIDTEAERPEGDAAPTPVEKKEVSSAPKTEVENYAAGAPSPAAKKILDEKGVDAVSIQGTGRNGRITKEDAIHAVPSMGTPTGDRPVTRKKMSLLRRKVAERLVAAKNETAMLTTFNEADMSAIFDLRKQYKESFQDKHGVSLGFMSFFTKAVVRALHQFPDVNSMIDGNEQIVFDYCDISVAVSGPKGLMVPVVRNAESMSFSDIESEIKRLAVRARDGKITVDEMTGGTFTISNGGVFGSMLSTPIINPPQSGILGMHNILQRPVAVDGKVEIRPMMYIALSYDHRIIDGKESVGFLVAVKEALEDPISLLMDGDAKKTLAL
ncbi:MAG: 2-oxoglutarate dehydrogenase complex dihydrolipoyllysine-residue succinyltransferase [Flavobacteriaceae bacterium]|nr:2-oxoglutarate dehydrogenase complex dihydrolipoyllysine-residue succinyltransferase [Flavobacteriaceae bacterium]